MNDSIVVGVDIGGSHITVAQIDCKKKKILSESFVRRPIDSGADAGEILSNWTCAITDSIQNAGNSICSIGIAMPGPFDYEAGISYMKNQNKYDSLYGLNLREMLGESLGLDGGIFHFSNDAACFLQGELFSGEDDPSLNVAGFTIGTGFGSALAKDGIAVDADLWCAPFKEGTVEDYFSTRWFIKEVRDRKGETVSDVKSLTDRKTDPVVEGIFNDFGENLACFLIEFYPNWNWEKVVLGGNISHAYALFAPALERTLEQAGCGIQIRVSTLGENAVLMGAASNASRFFKKNMQIR